jgi:hypothetical protein
MNRLNGHASTMPEAIPQPVGQIHIVLLPHGQVQLAANAPSPMIVLQMMNAAMGECIKKIAEPPKNIDIAPPGFLGG